MTCKLGDYCDTEKYFINTGFDGSHIWSKIHKIPKEIPCAECADHTDKNLKGLHDHINAGLDKPVYDKDNYHAWVNEVNHIHDKCMRSGKC